MKKYSFIVLMLLFFTSNIYCQTNIGKIWQCQTMVGYTPTNFSNQAATLATVFDTSPKIINIFVHVLNRNDGTGGLTNAQVDAWILLLCNDYLTHNISIREIGRSSLNNTTYFTKQINLTDFNNIITIDTHSN